MLFPIYYIVKAYLPRPNQFRINGEHPMDPGNTRNSQPNFQAKVRGTMAGSLPYTLTGLLPATIITRCGRQ
jgi:hypothetical protein